MDSERTHGDRQDHREAREIMEKIASGEAKLRRVYLHTEETCPGHIASKEDGKICHHCGTHADSLIPPEEDWY